MDSPNWHIPPKRAQSLQLSKGGEFRLATLKATSPRGGLVVETERNGRLIEEEADKRLQQSLYPELRRILCNYRHGILTLYGVVSSFHVRQIAQELVQGLEGIEV